MTDCSGEKIMVKVSPTLSHAYEQWSLTSDFIFLVGKEILNR